MKWFVCNVSSEKTIDSSEVKKMKESYLVEAEDYTEVSNLLMQYLSNRTDIAVESVRRIRIADAFLSGSDKIYKAKVGFITLNEKIGVEKKSYVQILLSSNDLKSALDQLCFEINAMMYDYEIVSISETNIVDVIQKNSQTL